MEQSEPDGGEEASDVAREKNLSALSDPAAKRLNQARIQNHLFGKAKPGTIGPYEVKRKIGVGGMGVVYEGFDPKLERKVALKLHPGSASFPGLLQRLENEAKALAKISHPNVVSIYSVELVDYQLVIAMEWLEGQTLEEWQKKGPRSWSEVLAMYCEAGRGLAAVHQSNLLHRDFKPLNVMVSGDGRVRIIDFGLVAKLEVAELEAAELAQPASEATRGGHSEEHAKGTPPPSDEAIVPSDKMTATGATVGTPRFVAPEVLNGKRASEASDQFSFCVAMYEALLGIHPYHPYPGKTDAAREARLRQELAKPLHERPAPRWLRRALKRGLSAAPEQRFPSMNALLVELERPRGWKRWRWAVAVGLLLVTSIALIMSSLKSTSSPPTNRCDGAAAELAERWSGEDQRDLERKLRELVQGLPGAAELPQTLLRGLDAYARGWAAQRQAACIAHRDGKQFGADVERRVRCLYRRRDALQAARKSLSEVDDASTLLWAPLVVAELPPNEDCLERQFLDAEVEPPSSPNGRAKLKELEARMAEATALEQLGQTAEAVRRLEVLSKEAGKLDAPVLKIDLALARGRIASIDSKFEEGGGEMLIKAKQLAAGDALLPRRIEAGARFLYVEARSGDPSKRDELIGRGKELDEQSAHLKGGFARALLLNNLGVLYMRAMKKEEAKKSFTAAKGARAALQSMELLAIERNLAMLEEDPSRRAELTIFLWRRRQDQLGPNHPLTLEAQLSHAMYLLDPVAATPLLIDVCDRYRTYAPQSGQVTLCYGYLADLALERDDFAAAKEALEEQARLVAVRKPGEPLLPQGQRDAWLASGRAALCDAAMKRADPREERRALDEARRFLEQALALNETTLSPADGGGAIHWQHKSLALIHLSLGLAWPTYQDLRAPIEHLERAIEIYEALRALNANPESQRRLAQARSTLACLLRRARREPSRSASLARQAEDFYREANAEAYRARLPGETTDGRGCGR